MGQVINYIISLLYNLNFDFVNSSGNVVNILNEKTFIEKTKNLMYKTIIWDANDSLWYKLKYFIVVNVPFKVKKYVIQINNEGNKEIIPNDNCSMITFMSFLTLNEIFPLYKVKNDYVGVCKNETHVYIVYTSETILNTFISLLNKECTYIPTEKVDDPVEYNQIMFHNQINMNIKYQLYRDRNFDNLISVHKPLIKEYLDSFVESLSGKSRFNGHGSYNLGIMLYGQPGCGKTTLIKDIANYLNREVIIVNMRDIKTCNDFKKLFYGLIISGDDSYYKKYVYVLEEIDCIDSVLSRSNEPV